MKKYRCRGSEHQNSWNAEVYWAKLASVSQVDIIGDPSINVQTTRTGFKVISRHLQDQIFYITAYVGRHKRNEPPHEKPYNKTCAISTFAQSDLSLCWSHMHSTPLPNWFDMQTNLRLCWSHMSYYRFSRALALMWTATWDNYLLICAPKEDSSQPHQSLCCSREETLHTWLSKLRPVKMLIRLRECKSTGIFAGRTCPHVRFLIRCSVAYSRTSMAQTPIARLPWLIRTRFWVSTKFFRHLKKTNIYGNFLILSWNCMLCVLIRIASSRRF